MAQQTSAKKLFDLLVSRDFDPDLLDSSGQPAQNPADAEIFSFDFRAESGKDYGTVVLMLGDDGELDVYCADNVGKTMEGQDKNDWFNFLHQIKNFAVKNFMSFGIKNLNRLRYSMQGQAAIKESIFESWTGTKTASWNGRPTEARLMIKHKKTIGEGDARFRYVESLFVETAEGERYKLPFTKLSGGRAMVEHVRNGGKPYDARGNHIAEMVNEMNVLSRFRRANQGKIFEGDTAQLVEQTNAYYENLQRTLKGLSHKRGYTTYFESWTGEPTEQEVVIEGLKHLFVTQSIDSRIEDALPLLAKIQQQENAMKEANIFEAWANKLMEGTWQLPDTPEKQAQLVKLLSADLPVGADATNATEQLYDLLGDDELFDQLEALADQDANADARQVVYDRMQMLSDDPDIRAVMDQVQIEPEAEMNPAAATDAGASAPPDEAQVPEVPTMEEANTQHLEYQDDLAAILKAAGVDDTVVRAAPDYEEEVTDEGVVGTAAGGVAGAALGSLVGHPLDGAIIGAGLGQAATQDGSNIIEDDEETDEGVLGTVGGAALGGLAGSMVGFPILGTAAGAALGQDATSGGSGIIEQDDEETDEGWKGQLAGGTVGTLAGGALGAAGGPIGSMIGGALGGTAGQMIGDKLGGNDKDEETDEGKVHSPTALVGKMVAATIKQGADDAVEVGKTLVGQTDEDKSPLAGKYGHSGKMKAVSKDLSFLDRLKELSGLKR